MRLINIVSRGSINNVNLEINTYSPRGVRKSEVLSINLRGPSGPAILQLYDNIFNDDNSKYV